jgi:NADPH-dependent 2,4-dienoyl-CoA reductase/sulfur reductase-like enzyme/rhodanese-related sulfurtransferase
MSKIVIVGGVAGGATAAARLRRLDEKAEIIVIERTGFVSYANCGLPYYVGGVIEDQDDLTLQSPQSFFSRFNIDVRVSSEVTSIDRSNKTVTVFSFDEGREYVESYDKLILSPGAKAMIPDTPGVYSDRVLTLRTVEDALRMRELIEEEHPERAVVVGGGFIGLETAENLMEAGVKVTLLQRSEQVLPPLDWDMACELHAHLRAKGLDLRFKHAVESYEETENGIIVHVKDHEPIECGFVVLGVGVVPETDLAKAAGLELGMKGSIKVDSHMRTSDPDIYAVGDAVEVVNPVTGKSALVALAGPANKQGRIAADNICGIPSEYKGTQGSTVIKVFDMTAAVTGLNEKAAKAAGVKYAKVLGYSASHASYYPGGHNMSIKTLFDPDTGRILGAQIVGFDGVDKRIDVMATAIRSGLTADELCDLELAYAPPYSSAKDPVNMAGFMIQNVMNGIVKQHFPEDVPNIPRDGSVTILDVRTASEFAGGCIEGAVNIPLHELRSRLGELDKSKPIFVNCFSGMRSYIACRILTGNGFDCSNLAGGWRFYQLVTKEKADNEHYPCGERK